MGYSIIDIPSLKIVEVTVDGLLDLDTKEQVLSKSFLAILRKNYERLMIDIDNTFSPLNQTMTDALYLTSFMKTIGFHESIRLALVSKKKEDIHLYLESATMAQGVNLKYFNNREQAITWLCA